MGKLSALKVQRLREPGRYGDGDGLWLQIGATGGKSWLLRYMLNGRARQMGLGPLTLVSLADARGRAWEARRQLLNGIDPLEAKTTARAAHRAAQSRAMTFRQCAEGFMNSHEAGWRNEKHRWQWSQTLSAHCYPVFGSLDVAAVDRALVLRAIEPIWTTLPETAGRLRGRIERVLSWATARNLRTGDNPAKWKGGLDALLPARSKVAKVVHYAAMDWREIPAFMADLRAVNTIGARALEFTVLTAARTGETIGAEWREIDQDHAVWAVPAERMKAGKEHRIPLTDRATAILTGLPRLAANPFLFPGAKRARGLSNLAMLMQLRRMRPGLTVHGFRSSFRDWAGEATHHPREICEAALAHQIGNAVEQAYRRGDALDKRRQLMKDWAAYCESGANQLNTR